MSRQTQVSYGVPLSSTSLGSDPNMVAEEMVLACGGANPESMPLRPFDPARLTLKHPTTVGRFTNDMIYYGCKILEPALLQYSYGKADIEALILDCYHEVGPVVLHTGV